MGIQRVPNLLRWTVLACCLPYPGDPKSAIDCFFLFGISLHPGVTGSAPHWKFRGCRVHSFPSPQELLRPASWLALLSRTFTFELAPTRSPSISVEYDYVDKQSIPTAGLSPASPTALWAAGHRISPGKVFDFHSLRCQMATLADAAGISPRVVQRLMRHSKLEMTGRYTRPRTVDIDAAASMLPSLKPDRGEPESMAATGTDPAPVSHPTATQSATLSEEGDPNSIAGSVVASSRRRKVNPLVEGSSPSPVISAIGRDRPSSRTSFLPARLFSGGRRRAFLRRRGLVDDGGQQIRQAPTRVARAGRKLGHLGKAELRIGKRQSALGLLGRRHERVLLVPVPHLDTAPLEQFEFAVKRPQTDAQVRENCVPCPRGLGQKPDQAMKPCCALQGDVNRGAATSARRVGHDRQSCMDHDWSAARNCRLRLAAPPPESNRHRSRVIPQSDPGVSSSRLLEPRIVSPRKDFRLFRL